MYIYIYIYVSGLRFLGPPPPHPRVGSGSLGRGFLIQIHDFSKDSSLRSHFPPEQL